MSTIRCSAPSATVTNRGRITVWKSGTAIRSTVPETTWRHRSRERGLARSRLGCANSRPRKTCVSDPSRIEGQFLHAQERLVLQSADFSLETVAQMVDDGAIDTAPRYQRRDRWKRDKQSALIESFLLNIPVPPVYLSEDEFGSYSVIDGKQRLTTIRDFMRNDFSLIHSASFPELRGLYFRDLPRELANALRVRPYIRVVTLLKQSDPELKYQVFLRLNTGGEPLNAQEIRNVAFRGPLNDLIYELSADEFLHFQLKIRDPRSPNFRNMLDAEWVLRFLTLSESWETFAGDLRRSMDDFMRFNQRADEMTRDAMSATFLRSITACHRLWGSYAFKRPVVNGWRDLAIAGMYDAEMIAVSQLSDRQIANLSEREPEVLDMTQRLFGDPDFEAATTQATNTPSRVQFRIERMARALTELAA
jgi:hypothetical protein